MSRNQDAGSTVDPNAEVIADPTATEVKAPKVKKAPTRGTLPDGYVTPVGLAKAITVAGLHFNKDGVATDLKPQVVYSYIKNATKEDPFPMETVVDSIGKSREAVKADAGIAWWTRKNDRTAARKVSLVAKAEAKAAKVAAAPAASEVG